MKALFIGLGSIGQRHLRNLQSLRPDIEIIAVRRTRTVPVLDSTNQVIQGVTISQQYGITEFDSLDLALAEKPGLVFVTNPSNMHLEAATKALESGAHVFVEKPLSHDWEGVDELLELERSIGEKRIAVGYQFRFHPVMQLVESILDEGRIGELVGARLVNGEYMPGWHPYEDYRGTYAARKDLGGGAIVTQIHDFDYALWFFGLPKKVFSVGGHLSSLEIDVEDSAQVIMSCEANGKPLPVSINLDYLQWPPKRGFSIVGELGTIECDLIKNIVTVSHRPSGKIMNHEFSALQRNDIFLDELRNFLDFSENKDTPVVDLELAAQSLKIALAAKQSIVEGVAVSLNGSEL